jgi:Protein of unknown function (DUF2808)
MLVRKVFWLRLLMALTVFGSGAMLTPQAGQAEFTLFSGVEQKDQLGYSLDFGNRSVTDRYRLRISGKKMPLGATQINIVYPDYYNGKFDEAGTEIMLGDKSIPVASTKWDKENRTLQIMLKERLQTKNEIEIVLNNVRNPDTGGIFYFDCQVKSSDEFPLARYAGTWILNIN